MILYAKYDDEDVNVDIIYAPDALDIDIELKQKEFFNWLFDKSNKHEYWKELDGKKTYCEYDVEAFVKWLNVNVYMGISDKAKVIMKNSSEKVPDVITLFF